ncbi:MAG TPA: PfkB family carbohydrate kinase [Candidatus Limnocylindrales bacterium]
MIVIPAVHPAREVVARVPAIRLGEVHRTTTTLETIGGKAINVARFAAIAGGSVRLIVLGDEAIRHALATDPILGHLPGDASSVTIVPSTTPSRLDVAIVDDGGRPTVINGTAAPPPAATVMEIEALTLADLRPGDIVVLSGSLPPGTTGLLDRVVRRGRAHGATVIVDASGAWLREALDAGPNVVKVNRAEAAAAGAPDPRPLAASGSPFDGPAIVAVTDGGNGLRAWVDGIEWSVTPPPDLEVVNTLAAGDAVTAGLAIALARGASALDALRLGVAMASARLRHVDFTLDPDDIGSLERAVRLRRLG